MVKKIAGDTAYYLRMSQPTCSNPLPIDYGVLPTHHSPGLHRVAILTAATTFPLIFMGGLVTSHQAGMSVPDWPNSYGYNMFLFPWSQWQGGIFYEHTHRLAGIAVGMLSILLTVWACVVERRPWVRWLSAAILLAVIAQGVLGGLRVIWVNLDLAIIHGCLAQAFFCLTALMVAATSRWWMTPIAPPSPHSPASLRGLARLAWLAVSLIYLQLVIGAVMRHYQAGLAIPDLPWAYGKLLPPTSAAALAAANKWRVWQAQLDPVTMTQLWLHFAHRLGAIAAAIAVAALIFRVLRHHCHEPLLLRPAILLLELIQVQLTLGVLTVLWRKPADIASYHVAAGALLLYVTFYLAIRARRLAIPMDRPASA